MHLQKYTILLLLSFTIFIVNANALVISGPDIIAAPSDVTDDAAVNTHQQAFNEVQNYSLLSDLDVDSGVISAGTLVNSHMIFLNTSRNTYAEDTQTWGFDGIILGVMSDRGGNLESASSSFLGAPGTTYPGSFSARGLENNPLDGLTNDDWYSVSGDMIDVFMRVTEPGDWIRVVTAPAPVPEPSTMLLLGSGLVGLAWYGRKRKKT